MPAMRSIATAIANHLRNDDATPIDDASLRTHERAFAARLREDGDTAGTGITAQLAEAFDRMTDSIDTLAHVLRPQDGCAAR